MSEEEKVCYFCGDPIRDDDDYCPGCRVFICEWCRFFAETSYIDGRHEPEDHGIPKIRAVR